MLNFMLIHIDYDEKHTGVSHWAPAQLISLQIQILIFLNEIMPKITREFKEIQGLEYCIRFLGFVIERDSKIDLARVDLKRQHDLLLLSCLQLLLSLVEFGPTSKKTMVNLNIFPMLRGMFVLK